MSNIVHLRSLWDQGSQMGQLIWFPCLLTHVDASRSGQKSGKATWTAPWRRAPAEKAIMRRVSEVCIIRGLTQTASHLLCADIRQQRWVVLLFSCGATEGKVCRGSDFLSENPSSFISSEKLQLLLIYLTKTVAQQD